MSGVSVWDLSAKVFTVFDTGVWALASPCSASGRPIAFSLPKRSELDPVGNTVQPPETGKNHEARAECIEIKLPKRRPGVKYIEHSG